MQFHLTIQLKEGNNHLNGQNDSAATGKESKTSEKIADVLHLRLNPPASEQSNSGHLVLVLKEKDDTNSKSETTVNPDALEQKKSKDANTRNVVIAGRMLSGKSTINDVLENVCHVADRTSLFGFTKEPRLHESAFGGYKIQVLDTPGLFQRAKIGETKRENGEIAQAIQESVKTYFGGDGYNNVDTVLIPISFTDGVNSEDIEAIKFFTENLPPATKKILVVTRAEGYSENDRNSLLHQISQHRDLSKLVDAHFGGTDHILFNGTLEKNELEFEISTTRHLEQIYLDRERLIKALLPTEEPVDLKEARLKETAKQVEAFLETHFPKQTNVLIVGRTHSGKSTISNVLENVCNVAEPASLFGLTQEPKLHESKIGGYQVQVLDTPGLFQIARDNCEIAQAIQESVKKHFGGNGYEKVDTVLMPISFTSGVMSEDIEAIKFFTEKLPPTTKKILVVTKAEGYSENDRSSLLDQISRHRELSKLVDVHFGGTDKILFTGTLEKFDVSFEKTTKRKLRQVYQDRESLIKAVLPMIEQPILFKQARLKETAKQVGAFLETHFPQVVFMN